MPERPASEPRPRIWRIEVTRRAGRLRIPPATDLPLRAGDTVMWVFAFDLPEGTIPGLLLTERSGKSASGPLGPFTMLDFQPPRAGGGGSPDEGRFRIYGCGFGGDEVPLDYRAALYRFPSHRAENRSNVGRIRVVPRSLQVAPQQVTVSLELPAGVARGKLPRLRVAPGSIAIPPGAPVVWTFDVPLDLFGGVTWYPEVVFEGSAFGPFDLVTVLVPPVGADPLRTPPRVIGHGETGRRGRFRYLCRVRSADRVLAVSSGDPGVDNDGELMTPPRDDLSQPRRR